MPVVPFASVMQRDIHFKKHGHGFGATTAVDYERMADAFMFQGMNATTHECTRPNGNLRNRMDFNTVHFGVAVIRRTRVLTFYIPTADTISRHGGVAQLFADYCGRAD
jgi:pyocin large subunit-like protein